ncbi:MAG TPA: GGDEF domain-containing protein [Terriglobales bacterium]|nr:GGDEF domain-containing protein [Terriglobales bacterium]
MDKSIQAAEPEDRIEVLQRELEGLEGRDFEIWAIGALIGLAGAAALVAAVNPQLALDFRSIVKSKNSPELVLGLFALILLLNAYLYYERRVIRANRRELLRQLIIVERSAQLDPLTGAFNRRCLDRLMVKEISRAQRKSTPLTVLMVDVDNFKDFNSRFGHLVGDNVLHQVAEVLGSSVRASDTVIRFGGDEFVILLGDTSVAQADVVVHRIHEYLGAWSRKDKQKEKHSYEVTVTCGMSELAPGRTATDLLRIADEDMLARKKPRADETTFSTAH